MIKNVIFDLGNVVLKLKWNVVLDKYSDNQEDKELLNKVIFESEEWQKLDEGTIKKQDAINIMISKLPQRLHNSCIGIMRDWQEGFVINIKTRLPQIKIHAWVKKNCFVPNFSSEIPLERILRTPDNIMLKHSSNRLIIFLL